MGKTSGLCVVASLFRNRWILLAANDHRLELPLLLAIERPVRERPLLSIAIAAGVGVLAGALLMGGRRS